MQEMTSRRGETRLMEFNNAQFWEMRGISSTRADCRYTGLCVSLCHKIPDVNESVRH